jgi:hypothetical protein
MSAHGHHYESLPAVGEFKTRNGQFIAGALTILGLVVFAVTLVVAPQRAWAGLLQAMLVPTLVGVGALFYIAVHSVTGAVWMLPLRRLMEGLSLGVYLGAVMFAVIGLFGAGQLFDWVALDGTAHAALFHVHGGSKSWAMTWQRYYPMELLIVGLWCVFRWRLVGLSLAQDAGAEVGARHYRWSVAWLMVFAPSFTLFVWDNLLSLHVNWFSTMWGVYVFASAVQTFLCVLVLLVLWLRRGPLKAHINHQALHDLSTWMVAWSCFCAYIGFSQYMLIYYANLDEETFYYVMRTQHGYGTLLVIEALLRWPLPFLGLMSQSMRTRPSALLVISSLVLLGNWIDWSWIIMPAFSANAFRSPFGPEFLMGLGAFGALALAALLFWQRRGLLPIGDPKLLASINAEHRH